MKTLKDGRVMFADNRGNVRKGKVIYKLKNASFRRKTMFKVEDGEGRRWRVSLRNINLHTTEED